MSRARPIVLPDGTELWFDTKLDGQKAKPEHLEWLAAVEDLDIDDLLDETLTQGEVIAKLRGALGQGTVPPEVQERRKQAREARRHRPACRICGKIGDSTKHHFVNRWIMRELSNYREVANRKLCTIPVCVTCHRDLHDKSNGPHSIVEHLEPAERQLANILVDQTRREKPGLWKLLTDEQASDSVYEVRLCRDWLEGKFDHSTEKRARVSGDPGP